MKYTYFFLLGAFVFSLDALSPIAYYDWFLYWILVTWASGYYSKEKVYFLSGYFSILVISSLFLFYFDNTPLILNHIFGLIILWFLTYWLVKFRQKERSTKNLIVSLEKKQEELNSIYNRIDEIVFALDRNWIGVYKNAASDRQGYNFINVGDNFFEKMPKLIGTPLHQNMIKALETRQTITFLQETMYTAKPRILNFSIYPSEDGVLVFTKDITELILAQREAEKANRSFQHLIERIEDAMWALDKDGVVTFANEKFILWSGKKREEIVGHEFYEALPLLKGSVLEQKFNEALNTQVVVKFEMESVVTPGMYLNLSVHPSDDGITIFAQDFTEYKDTRIKLQKALEDKEYLLKEIHHRIKNNLQIISSIINIQRSAASDEKVKEAITDIANRLQGMSFLHSKLQEEKILNKIDASIYIHEIVNYLRDIYKRPEVQLNLQLEEIQISIQSATSIGIIVNELVSNSFKYAFRKDRSCKINISLNRVNGSAELIVSDNGAGYPEEKLSQEGSLGLELVRHLTDQLDGNVKIQNQGGACTAILFPLKKSSEKQSGKQSDRLI